MTQWVYNPFTSNFDATLNAESISGINTINATMPDGTGNYSITSSGNTLAITTITNGLNIELTDGFPISPAKGGTGINNGTNTLTLAGTLQTSGNFSSVFTMTGNTSVTFPTSGTLITSASLSNYLPLSGGTLTGTLGLDGDPVSHIGIDWLGADQENYERVQNNFLQALAVVDFAGNQYWHVNSLTVRPKLSLDLETQINTPFIDTNVLATGNIYNASGTLLASASGGSVTGSGTNFPTACANGIIYWPSNQNYARITARNSATSLTIDTIISISSLPFVIYWGGIAYNPQTNILALSSLTSLVMGDGSSFALSGAHSTTLTTTGSTNVTLPTIGTLATTSQIPTGEALTKADDTNVTLTLGGSASTALVNAASITAGWTGQLSLARGGTNASLTASNGGIFYSTASAGAILSGTATAGKMLQSGATAAPTWSTTTYPSTNAINTLLYASSANVMSALATANNGVLTTGSGGIPAITALAARQLIATNSSGTVAARALSVNIQVISATGTYTPTTGMLYCIAEIVGSGAGGGGVASTTVSQFSGAAGGSAGEYARGVFSAATIGASQSVTIGAAGAGGAAGNNNGSNGNTTSFGALMTAAGGVGGGGDAAQSAGSTVVGPTGGGVISPGTGGSFRCSGGTGGTSHVSPVANIINGGNGGQSMFSGGAVGTLNIAGSAAVGYGGGGSGASRIASQTAAAGGAGAPGVCIVTEFIIN